MSAAALLAVHTMEGIQSQKRVFSGGSEKIRPQLLMTGRHPRVSSIQRYTHEQFTA